VTNAYRKKKDDLEFEAAKYEGYKNDYGGIK